MNLKNKAKELVFNVKLLFFAMKHPATPWYAKFIGGLTLAYALSPIDLIPDFIPVIGLLDDAIIVPAGIYVTFKMIPEKVKRDLVKKIKNAPFKPQGSALGALLIVSIWLLLAVIVISALYQS